MSERPGTIRLPGRDITVPSTMSREAQAVLANPPAERAEFPALDDPAAWRAMIAAHDGALATMMAGRAAAPVKVRHRDLAGGAGVYELTPDGLDDGDDRVYLDIHGGGFIYGGGELCATMAVGTAVRMAARVWAVDYRMPPDHPFPAALDDCLAAYRALLGRAAAGADRDRRRVGGRQPRRRADPARPRRGPAPAGRGGADDAGSGPHRGGRLPSDQPGLDPLIPGSGRQSFLLYAAGRDLGDPYLSPLNGDFGRASRPPSSPPAPATCCCPTPCSCTGPCAGPASRPSCT